MKQTISDEELLARVKEDLEAADSYYSKEVQPKIDKWRQLATGDPDYYKEEFPGLSGKFISMDVANTVEYIMPDLMKLFNGAKEPISVRGRTAEDAPKAETMQTLCNWQLAQLNNNYLLNYNWFKEALYYGLGIVKARWERKYKTDEYETIIGIDAYQNLMQQGAEIISAEPVNQPTYDTLSQPDLFKVRYRLERVEKNQPVFENLKAEEFRFDPEARNVKDAAFTAHIKEVSVDYLRRQEQSGVYKNIDEAVETYKEEDPEGKSVTDTCYDKGARKKVTIKEYYGKIDINDDETLEDVVVTICGDVILSVQENTFGRYPFFVLSGIIEPHQVQGRSMAQLIEQIQNLKTVMVREMITNAARNNDRRTFVSHDSLEDPKQLTDGDKYIAVKGDPKNIITYEPFEPISPNLMNLLQYAERTREVNSGVTEVKQGVTPVKQMQSATEAQLRYEAANSRVQIIARIFAETGVRELYEWLVDANQKFIDQPQVLRLTNGYLELKPDDISNAFFDLDISAGIGTGMTEQRIQGLQALLQLSMGVLLPNGLSNPTKLGYIVEKLIEEMGFKDIQNFIITEQERQQIMQQQQMQAQQQQMLQQQQMQQQMQGGMPQLPQQGTGGQPQGIPQRMPQLPNIPMAYQPGMTKL